MEIGIEECMILIVSYHKIVRPVINTLYHICRAILVPTFQNALRQLKTPLFQWSKELVNTRSDYICD